MSNGSDTHVAFSLGATVRQLVLAFNHQHVLAVEFHLMS